LIKKLCTLLSHVQTVRIKLNDNGQFTTKLFFLFNDIPIPDAVGLNYNLVRYV